VIVCSCNVISDHQVRSVAAEHSVRGTSEVYRCLGCSAACGRCARTIRNIVDEVLAECGVVAEGTLEERTLEERTIVLPASPGICASAEPSSACGSLEEPAENAFALAAP
jgi:bacterioferritin-associated ferredoxin